MIIPSTWRYEKMLPEDAQRLASIYVQSLGFPESEVPKLMESTGFDTFRVARDDTKILAGLSILPIGQWFGGRSIPSGGFTLVAVPPEHRGKGAANFLMINTLEELYREGIPLATLYPTTATLYRKSGFERAGIRYVYEMKTADIRIQDRTLEMERVTDVPSNFSHFQEAYIQQARQNNGHLDRNRIIWDWAINPSNAPRMYRYFIKNGTRIEGYVCFLTGGGDKPLVVRELVLLTREAARRLLTFFSDYRSLVSRVLWPGGYQDPLKHLVKEPIFSISSVSEWMLRIVDVERALRMRGYPRHLNLELHLEFSDDVLTANNGPFVLRLDDGEATVKPGGTGRIKMDIRDIASLYSGFLTPAQLQMTGNLRGTDEDLSLLQLVFSGPQPWMMGNLR